MSSARARAGTPSKTALPVAVLFVNTDLRVGGQERALVEIVRGFDRSRIRPVVACLKEEGELAPLVRDAGIPLYTELITGRYDARVLWRLARIIRREQVRIVCTVGCGDKMFWGRLAGWLSRVDGIVSTIHKTRNADGSPVIERANRWLTPITDCFVAVARGAAEYLVREEGLPREKMRVIYNGVDTARFAGGSRSAARAELGLEEGDKVAAHVAVFRPEKGHDVLIAAAEQVVAEVPRARFLLVGDGLLRPRIEELCAARGLRDSVRFLGQRSDVDRILAASDLAILSSRARVETFPNSVLEAMSSGLPVVATNVGSLEEMIEDGTSGRLVPEGDPGALARAVTDLFRDPERARDMGRRARERVTSLFNREQMIRERESLFLDLTAA